MSLGTSHVTKSDLVEWSFITVLLKSKDSLFCVMSVHDHDWEDNNGDSNEHHDQSLHDVKERVHTVTGLDERVGVIVLFIQWNIRDFTFSWFEFISQFINNC